MGVSSARRDGEHGSHALVFRAGQKIYYINGNFVNLPSNLSPTSAHRNYADDQVLRGLRMAMVLAPARNRRGGFLLRLTLTQKLGIAAAGMRNNLRFPTSIPRRDVLL